MYYVPLCFFKTQDIRKQTKLDTSLLMHRFNDQMPLLPPNLLYHHISVSTKVPWIGGAHFAFLVNHRSYFSHHRPHFRRCIRCYAKPSSTSGLLTINQTLPYQCVHGGCSYLSLFVQPFLVIRHKHTTDTQVDLHNQHFNIVVTNSRQILHLSSSYFDFDINGKYFVTSA